MNPGMVMRTKVTMLVAVRLAINMHIRGSNRGIVGSWRGPPNSSSNLPTRAHDGVDTEEDQDDGDGKLHRESEPRGNCDFEDNDEGAHHQDGQRVAQAPNDSDAAGSGKVMLATYYGSDGNNVIGVGRVPHTHHQSQQRDSERRCSSQIQGKLAWCALRPLQLAM
jgi:hypothetical protein